MEDDSVIKAIEERLWTYTIGLLNHAVERKGRDAIDSRLRSVQYGDPGTAVAGMWGDTHFLVTAKHLVEEASVKDLLFFARPVGDLKRQAASEVRLESAFKPIALSDTTATIYRCQWEDLAVIPTTPHALGKFVEFFAISESSADPVDNDALIGMGFPTSSSLIFQKHQTSDPIERAIVLSPTPFSGVVLPSSRGRFFKDFDPERHCLMEYDPAKEGQHPKGISGAAVWMRNERRKDVWTVSFEFAGICTSCYGDGKIEQIVKASTVCQFLTETFGSV